jgi:hypothetical protein
LRRRIVSKRFRIIPKNYSLLLTNACGNHSRALFLEQEVVPLTLFGDPTSSPSMGRMFSSRNRSEWHAPPYGVPFRFPIGCQCAWRVPGEPVFPHRLNRQPTIGAVGTQHLARASRQASRSLPRRLQIGCGEKSCGGEAIVLLRHWARSGRARAGSAVGPRCGLS